MRHGPAVAALTTAALAAAFAAPAGAQEPASTTTTPTTTTPAPAPAPKPKAAKLTIRTDEDAFLVRSRVVVHGTMQPYVAGQKVVVRFYRGKKKLKAVEVTVKQDGKVGRFKLGYSARKTGQLTIRASHRATAKQKTAVAKSVGVEILPRRVGPGSTGTAVRILQQQLAKRGYVVGKRGVFDARTARAVVAFRKVTGMARNANANEAVFDKLAKGGGYFKVRFPKHGRHVEGDIGHQVLALIGAGGKVEKIYPISSGAPATPTILGSFRVYRKDPGTNAKGMVHSSYFIRGYAIHGYKDVPVYNASHGCLRVPIPDSMTIFNWVKFGTRVDTYR